nr:MAG TPA: hypothetical protein [Bacteriophage sp.]DAX15211.1 MAG TPA: hypothetical protein [Bacteriophage sp.]
MNTKKQFVLQIVNSTKLVTIWKQLPVLPCIVKLPEVGNLRTILEQ